MRKLPPGYLRTLFYTLRGEPPDTFARDLSDYPFTEHFRDSVDYAEYTEDIYTGCRYFETLPEAAERVCFLFGFGLSYTNFSLETVSARAEDGTIHVSVRVTNVGSRAGKEVVQLCRCPPLETASVVSA